MENDKMEYFGFILVPPQVQFFLKRTWNDVQRNFSVPFNYTCFPQYPSLFYFTFLNCQEI